MSGVEYLASDELPIKHGFFTRHGGVSKGNAASLNASLKADESKENVMENRRRVCRALNIPPENFTFLSGLEHGDRVLAIGSQSTGNDFSGYDALVTDNPGTALSLCVADCMPIIIYDPNGSLGLVHAGWRGAKEGIIQSTVRAMGELYDANPAGMTAVIGPAIAAESYEVGHEFKDYFSSEYVYVLGGKLVMDLVKHAADSLRGLGIKTVDIMHVDTYADERFYSHRRENGKTGRFFAVASL